MARSFALRSVRLWRAFKRGAPSVLLLLPPPAIPPTVCECVCLCDFEYVFLCKYVWLCVHLRMRCLQQAVKYVRACVCVTLSMCFCASMFGFVCTCA